MLARLKNKLFHRARNDFKGCHFDAMIIIQAINWYLRYCLSYRDIEELLLERGIKVDHSTINRWVLKYAPLMEKRLRNFRKPHCGSVRIDETYIKVKGQWKYLYRAIDKHGVSIDFLLTASRDKGAAMRFFRKAFKDDKLFAPSKIGTDKAKAFPCALQSLTEDNMLSKKHIHYATKILQQGIESDHSRLKRPIARSGGFQSFKTAKRMISGYEAMLWLKKGFGYKGAWTIKEQNQLLRDIFGIKMVNNT